MASELAERLAKLLRLACSNGPDGEKLAALGRLSAIAQAHGLDWDQVLANGNGAALSEDQMRRIYDEGYQRGYDAGQQAAQPTRDWTPTGGSAEAGEDADRLKTILEAAREAADAGQLTDWEDTFSADMLERFERFGSRMYISEKQWAVLDRLETKMRRAGFLID